MTTQAKPPAKTAPVDDRNRRLSFDLFRAALDDPSLADAIPDGATITIVPDDDPELAAAEIAMGIEAVHNGENVYFIHTTHAPDGTLTIKRPPEGTPYQG